MLLKELTLHEELVSYLSDNGIKQQFITALIRRQGEFYERLVALVKTCQGIRAKRFTLDHFPVILDEVKLLTQDH